jgi:hypothetical protein
VFAVGGEGIVGFTGCPDAPDLGRLLPLTRQPQSELALALKVVGFTIESTSKEHISIKSAHLVRIYALAVSFWKELTFGADELNRREEGVSVRMCQGSLD